MKKYLSTWAEPDTALANVVSGPYERCLVVPVCREDASALDGYVRAAATSSGRTLAIVVVNGAEAARAELHAENARFFDEAVGRLTEARRVSGSSRAVLGAAEGGSLDVLLVDRASEGARLPPKTGVGLARKIGADIALSLHSAGKVRSPFVFFTDADATLPEGHFERAELAGAGDVSAAVFPFWHDPGPDPAVNRATALHELSLRYYVRGLAFAGSPYAFHSLGSAMAVHAWAYAAVRGVPKREAGEDFYLLGKAAKVGVLARASMPSVRLRSRASDRTPFGTGAGVSRRLARAGEHLPLFYAPECFIALRRWLAALDAFSEHGSVARLAGGEGGLLSGEWGAAEPYLFDARGRQALEALSRQARSSAERRVRAHEWFDSFRTLKFVHALRRAPWPSVEWADVRRRAPFLPDVPDDADFDAMRRALLREEAARFERFGPLAACGEPVVQDGFAAR